MVQTKTQGGEIKVESKEGEDAEFIVHPAIKDIIFINKSLTSKNMFKQFLLKAIIKEMKLCRRLYTKIPPEKLNFRPKENTRSMLEVLQYLSFIGTSMLKYWSQESEKDFGKFFRSLALSSGTLSFDQFLPAINEQIKTVSDLFNQISEEDLYQKQVMCPWGLMALGEAIVETEIKWLAAYKLQLFLYIKLSTDQPLATPDAWVLTDFD